jgi:hypothetical protein
MLAKYWSVLLVTAASAAPLAATPCEPNVGFTISEDRSEGRSLVKGSGSLPCNVFGGAMILLEKRENWYFGYKWWRGLDSAGLLTAGDERSVEYECSPGNVNTYTLDAITYRTSVSWPISPTSSYMGGVKRSNYIDLIDCA